MFYYVDSTTGKIYFVNNEDYWYDAKAYIQIVPHSSHKLARLWYGWDNFAQGGVNEAGLVFDGAATPSQKLPQGFYDPGKRNVGDEMLASCKSVAEAIAYLDKEKIAVSEGHLLLGDKAGNAVILEWVNGARSIIPMKNNILIASNFLLSDTSAGNYPCYRYQSIEQRLQQLRSSNRPASLKEAGNAIAGSVQLPQEDKKGRIAGTLYTTFVNLTDMEFVLVYKLDKNKTTKLDLKKEFQGRKRKIPLQ